MRFLLTFSLSFIFIVEGSLAAKPEPLVHLAVLTFQAGESGPLIRYGFTKNKKWRVLDSNILTPNMKWIVAFDGKSLGEIKSKKRESNSYSDEHSLLVDGKLKVKKFTNKGNLFATWSGYDKYRPMILVSGGSFSDPEGWKPIRNKRVLSLVKKTFAKNIGPVTVCEEGTFEEKPEKVKIKSDQISLIKMYGSKLNEFIVGVRLPDYDKFAKCDGLPPESFTDHWYHVKKEDMSLIGNQIIPVDAGDYDSDGRSEWVFQSAKYNRDGYGLYLLESKRLHEFSWSYH